MKTIRISLFLIFAAAFCQTSHAQATFAQFDESNATAPFTFTNGNLSSSFTGTTTGNFTFLVAGAPVGPQAATITLSSMAVTPATAAGPFLFQPVDAAMNTLTITRTSDSANLLTVTFTGTISGFDGDVSGTLSANNGMGDTVVYTSDFLNFSGSTIRSMGLALSGIDPGLSQNPDNLFLDTFVTDLSGSFASDVAAVAAVPEPSTWAIGTLVAGLLLMPSLRTRSFGK